MVDFAKLGAQAAAEGADQTKAQAGGGGDYKPPAEGACHLRLVGYIELGKQKDTIKGVTTIKDKVQLVFEVSGKNHPPHTAEDGTKTPIRVSVEENLSLNEKANFFKLFTRMNYAGKAQHMVQLLGEGYSGRLIHRKYKKKTDPADAAGWTGVAVELRDKDGWKIEPPFFEVRDDEGNPTGEKRALNIAPALTPLKGFLWKYADLEQWASLYIEGSYPERKNDKGEVIAPAKSKNVIQETIKRAENFQGSPVYIALQSAGQSLDVPDAEDPRDEDTGGTAEAPKQPQGDPPGGHRLMQPAWLAKVAEAAAAGSPMAVVRTEGRHLLADGDALAYYCAGSDDTSPAQARTNLRMFLRSCASSSGSEFQRVLVTGRGSHKGYRYAVAKVKPYQGQRSGSRRPKNWEFLRDVIEGGDSGFPTEITNNAEADDLFGRYSTELGPENVVILTQDKDMRMVPGWHMDWKERTLSFLSPHTFEQWHNDKCYGLKWFWLQMLHGDTADNIPGLPKYINENGRAALCGEKTALKLLAGCNTNAEARAVVFGLYEGYYGKGWQLHLLEQASLLWMRRDKESRVLNVCGDGGPLAFGPVGPSDDWIPAILAIKERVAACSV